LGPTDVAGSKEIDHPLELITLALKGVLDWLKSRQQTFGRQVSVRSDFRLIWKATSNDFITQLDALIADEDGGRTCNQLPHLML